MATNKPRITISLQPEHYAVISELAGLTKGTMSGVVVEILQEAVPVLARVVKLLKEAQMARDSVGDRVKELAVEAELEMLPMARAASATFDMFENEVLKAIQQAEAAKSASRTAGSDGSPKRRISRGRGQ